LADPLGLGVAAQAALHALADPDPEAARSARGQLALALAESTVDPVDEVNIALLTARLALRLGDTHEAASLAEQALSRARRLDLQDPDAARLLVQALADTADFRLAAGFPDDGLLPEALECARHHLVP
jgi:hypothetical protein